MATRIQDPRPRVAPAAPRVERPATPAKTAKAQAPKADRFETTAPARKVTLIPPAAPDPTTAAGLAQVPAFQALPETTRNLALGQLGAHESIRARSPLSTLATSPGFGRLSEAEQQRLLNYVGGQNRLVSEPARDALGTLLRDAAFTGADADGQAAKLREFVTAQPGALYVASSNAAAPTPAAFELRGPTPAPDHAWAGSDDHTPAVRYDVVIDGKTIPLYAPEAPPAEGMHTAAQAAEAIASMPASLRAKLTEVSLEARQNPGDAYWASVYGDPSFRSYATAGADGVVRVYPCAGEAPGQAALDATLIHEVGHTMSQRLWGASYGAEWGPWTEAGRSDGFIPSKYGANNPGEDFSETLVIYQSVKGTPQEAELRALMPNRFRMLDQVLGEAR